MSSKHHRRGLRFGLLGLLVGSVMLTLLVGLSAAADDTPGATQNLWFVEMNGNPTADGASLSTVQGDQTAFKSEAKKAGLGFEQRFSYTKLFNGLAIRTDSGTADAISTLPSVKNIYPVGLETLPPEEASTPDLATALPMTGADVAHNELGLTGA